MERIRSLVSYLETSGDPSCRKERLWVWRARLPGPCCVVLAMIHFTRQHFIRDLRVSRGLCHLEPSVCSA